MAEAAGCSQLLLALVSVHLGEKSRTAIPDNRDAMPRARHVLGLLALFASGCVRGSGPPDPAPPCPEIHGPPFPEAAHLTVRRSTEPNTTPFARCSLFPGSLGAEACEGAWSGTIFDDGTGVAGTNTHPSLATYGYILQFVGERAQLCREFGGEWPDERGCPLSDVRCATSGELVITAGGGGSLVADFDGGGRVEAAWVFRVPVDAGARADSWP